ncbi:hypothetical protein ID47_06220 [Candidatus Paracaedibacter acanthamoebae]|uniref:HTH lysR-type domain-containing protein n=2 Tax=Candidatus Odyssella acanthamoebae TaxID=91604 RepID=A0A077B0H8_9PROT|nr:hypothetical protein ID47_06220 [Candidatus Paracaedibacter acanthamoebae]
MVAREGNMTRAAEKLNVSQPSLSQLINDLEYNLKAKLFDRIPRGMRLTPQGEKLYTHAKEIIEKHEVFEKIFHEVEDELQGDLKIIIMPYIGTDWLIPNIRNFLNKYPQISLQIILSDNEIQDIGEHDIAICPLIPHQPQLIQEPLFTVSIRLFASESYLKKFGIPQKPEELSNHRLIVYRENYHNPYENWLLNIGNDITNKPRKAYIQIYSLHGMINCALNGLGIIEAPDLTNILNLGLKEVLPNMPRPQVPLYFIYDKSRKNSKKIIHLYNYLLKIGK